MQYLKDIIYFPAVRAGRFDLAALAEISVSIKEKISPILILRSNSDSTRDIENFIKEWDGGIIWLDSSRYIIDSAQGLAPLLNDPNNNFSNKLDFFTGLYALNQNVRPTLGFSSSDDARAVTQFGLHALNLFGEIALRIEINTSSELLAKTLTLATSFLNAVAEEKLSEIVLIVDLCSIDSMPNISLDSNVMKVCALADQYNLKHLVTLSTSWPDDRPERGTDIVAHCIDPIWQAFLHHSIRQKVQYLSLYYGDYAATNPSRDLGETFDPTQMSQPIPFAGYLIPSGWFQCRMGASGEWAKYQNIALLIQSHQYYHGDNYCWGTKKIASVAVGNDPGNGSVWNKVRINQHITAMTDYLMQGILQNIVNQNSGD